MNGSKTPDANDAPVKNTIGTENGATTANGTASRQASRSSSRRKSTSPDRGIVNGTEDAAIPDADAASAVTSSKNASGEADDGVSEAETLISSPVKRRELEKKRQSNGVKVEPTDQDRSPDLPRSKEDDTPVPEDVPTPGEDVDAVISVRNDTRSPTKSEHLKGQLGDDSGSDDLSEVSTHSSSRASSRASSRSRAYSERPGPKRIGTESPNPRKRKHRASSVTLPNKRPTIDPSKRRPRNPNAEETAERNSVDRSVSPRLRGHRRTASVQSGFADGAADGSSGRKRRGASQFPVREPRSAKAWEGSDASSETTSTGHAEQKRATRGIGRSTSTPGRPTGREHKRYVSKYGFTRMAEACEAGDLEAVREWREKDPDQLEIPEFAGNTPLQIAALNGNADIVEYLIQQGVRTDTSNTDKDTPLIDASENGHLDVVRALLAAGVDPMGTNSKGNAALDVVADDTDNADEIRAALREAIDHWNSDGAKQRRDQEEARFGGGQTNKGLHFMARTYENLLKLVQDNDRNGVGEFLDARVPVDNAIVAAAAKTGDTYLVNMLLAEMTEKKRYQKPEKPMLAVIGTSHFEVVKVLTMTEQFNPHYTNRQGKTWVEIAEDRQGPNWRQEKELLQRLYDEKAREIQRRSSSPVTKRDQLKRKPNRKAQEDDSDDDVDAPARKKNGRRLMSRKDIRLAAARATSDDTSDEDEDEEDAPGSPEIPEPLGSSSRMKPPDSPASKRNTPGRQRTRSLSAQGSLDNAPRTRRRSSSLRGLSELPLPSVEEQPAVEAKEEAEAKPPDVQAADEAREAEAKLALEEAQRLEAERKEAEEAAAEAKRKEEEAEAARVLEAKRVEEERKRAEEERLIRQREEEERQAEELRRKEAERIEAKRRYFEQMVSRLPPVLRYSLDASSGFSADGLDNDVKEEAIRIADARQFVARYCLPLQAVTFDLITTTDTQQSPDTSADELYVLNVQAANLLGKSCGRELLVRSESVHAVDTMAQKWHWLPVTNEAEARRVVRRWQPRAPTVDGPQYMDERMAEDLPFAEELNWLAGRANKIKETERLTLQNPDIELRWLRLRDVMENLHPWYKGGPIEVIVESGRKAKGIMDFTGNANNDEASSFTNLYRRSRGSSAMRQVWRSGSVAKSWNCDAGDGIAMAIVKHES